MNCYHRDVSMHYVRLCVGSFRGNMYYVFKHLGEMPVVINPGAHDAYTRVRSCRHCVLRFHWAGCTDLPSHSNVEGAYENIAHRTDASCPGTVRKLVQIWSICIHAETHTSPGNLFFAVQQSKQRGNKNVVKHATATTITTPQSIQQQQQQKQRHIFNIDKSLSLIHI